MIMSGLLGCCEEKSDQWSVASNTYLRLGSEARRPLRIRPTKRQHCRLKLINLNQRLQDLFRTRDLAAVSKATETSLD